MNEPQPQIPTKFCHACAVLLDARAEICPRCGVRQPTLGRGLQPQHTAGTFWFVLILLVLVIGIYGVGVSVHC